MTKRFLRAYYVGVYYMSWCLFGVVGLLLNLGCLPLLLLPAKTRRRFSTRPIIHWLFQVYLKWFHATGAMPVTWLGFEKTLPRPAVYIANHPSLLDAPILLARIPDAVCIFKPELLRNPVVGPAAILAGYVSGDGGVDLVRAAAARIREGRSILIFPEGTRTEPGEALGPLRPGFALIAERAQVPIQLLTIRCAPDLLRRGEPWWRPPRVLPSSVIVSCERSWRHDPAVSSTRLTEEVTEHLRARLGTPLAGKPSSVEKIS